MDEEALAGGVANAGAVVRLGNQVLRPVRPHSASVHPRVPHRAHPAFHDASARVGLYELSWSGELADPNGGTVVCLENVVFRRKQAIGLLDFDFAAPG